MKDYSLSSGMLSDVVALASWGGPGTTARARRAQPTSLANARHRCRNPVCVECQMSAISCRNVLVGNT